MNNFSIVRFLKCVALAGAMLLPAVTWADDHFLDVVVAPVPTPAIVTHTGTLTQPLTLAAGFAGEPAALVFTAAVPLTLSSVMVKMCAPGTGGNLEWLDQGSTVVGVTGTLTAASPTANYALALSMGPATDTYSTSSGTCAVQGAKTYNYTSSAVITKTVIIGGAVSNVLTNTYNFWNVSNLVPEPGTLFLLLIGMLGLGWMSLKRKNQVQRATV